MKSNRTSKASICGCLLILITLSNLTGTARGQMLQVAGTDAQILAPPVSSTGSETSRPEKERIETIIREYLLKNPSIIREAMQALQAREEEDRLTRAANNMKELRSAIFSDADSPTAGNANADVTIVVFFDYNCGYCKKTVPTLDTLLLNDASVRVIYKEYPILGPQSHLAAQAALASARQGKYVQFHKALMESQKSDEATIKSIADRLGLNYAALQRDMADPKINEQLDRNIRLAGSLDINGTPAYIVGDQIIPGAIDLASLTNILAAQRKKAAAATAAKAASR